MNKLTVLDSVKTSLHKEMIRAHINCDERNHYLLACWIVSITNMIKGIQK